MLNIKKVLFKILQWMQEPMVTATHSETESCAANTGTQVNVSLSKTGYYPVAIVGYQVAGDGSGSADVRQYRLTAQSSGAGTAFFYVWNTSGTTRNWTVTAQILWVKED